LLVRIGGSRNSSVERKNPLKPRKANLPSVRRRLTAPRLGRYGSAGTTVGAAVAPPPALRTCFPDVEELRIELEFDHESELGPSAQVYVLYPSARLVLRYACPFPGCSGSFDLENPVTELLKRSAVSFATDARCSGVRPRRGDAKLVCAGHMSARVTARYGRARR
jgi:hypothetical protein